MPDESVDDIVIGTARDSIVLSEILLVELIPADFLIGFPGDSLEDLDSDVSEVRRRLPRGNIAP